MEDVDDDYDDIDLECVDGEPAAGAADGARVGPRGGRFAGKGLAAFLQKPFTAQALHQKTAEVLE